VELHEKGKKVLDLPADLFIKKLNKKSGFASETEGDTTVVLDIALDDELIAEGHLRELIRSIQIARQDADLDITARIKLTITCDKATQELITANKQKICDEVLATEIIVRDGREINIKIHR